MTTDASVELVRSLIENLKPASQDWASLAMVLGFDGEKVDSVYGFAYPEEGNPIAVSASPSGIRSAVNAYTDAYYGPGEALPVGLLVQFDRTNGNYEITFEDTDQERWKVTPKNFKSIRHELRPNFTT